MSQSKNLGNWTCPSGNSVGVFCSMDDRGRWNIWFHWDDPPPLSPIDLAYYHQVIRPQATQKALSICSGNNQARGALYVELN